MAFPQASDYRPPIIPDGEIYDNPENGKSYYWTQILVGGSTPETATSISGYWTVVCEPFDNRHLLRHGDTVDDLQEPAEYIWNDDVQFESTGLKGVLLPKEIEKSETDEKHITNKEYVDTQDGILSGEADARSEFLCAQFFKVLGSYNEVEKADGHVLAEYNFGDPGKKYWTRPPKPGFFVNGDSYYINDQGPYELEQVTEENKWVTFFIKNGPPKFSLGSYVSFSKTRKLCTEIDFLQNEVIELEEEINAIAPSVERGQFISTTYSNAPRDGEFMLSTLAGKTIDYGDPGIALIQISKVDNEGVAHTYADAEEGQLLQLFEDGNSDYGLYLIEAVTGQNDAAMTAVTFTVSPVSGFGEATEGQLARLKIFSAPEGGTADGFVLKTGDTMTGELNILTEQPDGNPNYSVPSPKDKHLRFTTTDTTGGNSKNAYLFQPGYTEDLMTSRHFMSGSNIYTKGTYLGFSSTGGTNFLTFPPRLNFQNSGGGFYWSGTATSNRRVYMNSSGTYLYHNGKISAKWDANGFYGYYQDSLKFSTGSGGTTFVKPIYVHGADCRIKAQNSDGNSSGGTYGTAGQVLTSQGAAPPRWKNVPSPTYTITKSNGNYYVS